MATTAEQEHAVSIAPPRPAAPSAARSSSVVTWWAALGACFVLFFVYLMARWVLSGGFRSVPSGPTPVPGWMSVTVVAVQAIGVVAFVAVMYGIVIRPWRANGHLSWDGLFALAAGTLWWQDMLLNYGQAVTVYNLHLLNFGSWVRFIPGWMPPNSQNLAEPPLYAGLWYATFLILLVVAMNRALTKLHARWPQLTSNQLVLVSCGIGIGLALIIDPFYLRLGLYAYPGTYKPLTLFYGHYYQYPLYDAPAYGIWLGLCASLRFFLDDQGHSIVERGIERVRVGPRRRTFVRYLALVGVVNLIFMVITNVPLALFGMHATGFPKDITSRSYFVRGICGRGTSYACPAANLPVNRPAGIHIGPTGRLVGAK